MADRGDPGDMPFRMFLPATSANLGPAFDAAALAFDFGLRVNAKPAAEFSIEAHGRNADLCGKTPGNLIVDTYTKLLEREGKPITRSRDSARQRHSPRHGLRLVRRGCSRQCCHGRVVRLARLGQRAHCLGGFRR